MSRQHIPLIPTEAEILAMHRAEQMVDLVHRLAEVKDLAELIAMVAEAKRLTGHV